MDGGRIRWDCNTDHCRIFTNLCSLHWGKITLSRSQDSEETAITLAHICLPDGRLEPAYPCYAFPQNLFPLRPNQTLHGRLYSKAGKFFEFNFSTDKHLEIKPDASYIELESTTSDSDVPYALAWYDLGFKVRLSAFGCGIYGGIQSSGDFVAGVQYKIYFDADGNGFKSAQKQEISIPKLTREILDIQLQSVDGKVFGPFQYRISADKIINRAIQLARKQNRVTCGNLKINGSFQLACRPSRFGMAPGFDWTDVKSIRFGETKDDLFNHYEINLSTQDVIERFDQSNRHKLLPLFDYRPPKNAKAAFFEIEYKNGRKSLIERIELQ